jgi:hypothetical protein
LTIFNVFLHVNQTIPDRCCKRFIERFFSQAFEQYAERNCG